MFERIADDKIKTGSITITLLPESYYTCSYEGDDKKIIDLYIFLINDGSRVENWRFKYDRNQEQQYSENLKSLYEILAFVKKQGSI